MRFAKYWAVCELVELVSASPTHPIAEQIIALHDSFCCGNGLKLA